MPFSPRQFIGRLLARVKAWKPYRRAPQSVVTPMFINFVSSSYTSAIHRDVTPHGVRVYSLCGCCGSRLNASATLCEECAQKKRPARPI
jgi:hypothetical protein